MFSQSSFQGPPSPVDLARAQSNASLSPSVAPPRSSPSPSTSPIPSSAQGGPRSPSIRELRNYHAAQRKSFLTAVPLPSASTFSASSAALATAGPAGFSTSPGTTGFSTSPGLGISPSPSPTPPPIPNEHQRNFFYYRTRSGDLVNPEDADSVGGSSRDDYYRSQTSNTNRTLTRGEDDYDDDDQDQQDENELEEELELDYHQEIDNEQGHTLRGDEDGDDDDEERHFDASQLPPLQSSAPSAAHTEDDDTRRNVSSGSGSTSTTAAEGGPIDTEDTDPEPSSVFSSPTSTFYGLQTASVKQANAAANFQRLQDANYPKGPRRKGTGESRTDGNFDAETEDAYTPMPLPNLPKSKTKRGLIAHMRGKSSVDHIGSSLLAEEVPNSPAEERPALPQLPRSITGTLANASPSPPQITSSALHQLAANYTNNSTNDTSRLSARAGSSMLSHSNLTDNTTGAARLARSSQRTSRSLYSDDSPPESPSDEDEDDEQAGLSKKGQASGDASHSRLHSEPEDLEDHLEDVTGGGIRRSTDAARTTRSSFGNLGPLPSRASTARLSSAAPASRRSSGAAAAGAATSTTAKRFSNSRRTSQNSKASRRMSKSAAALVLRRSTTETNDVLDDGEDHPPSMPSNSYTNLVAELGKSQRNTYAPPNRGGGLSVDSMPAGMRRGSTSGTSEGIGTRGRSATGGPSNTDDSSPLWRRPSAPALSTNSTTSPLIPQAEILAMPQARSNTPTVQLSAATPPSADISQMPGAAGGSTMTPPSTLKPASRSPRSLSVSSGQTVQSPPRSGADFWLSSASARTAPSSPALSSRSQELMTSDPDLVLGSKDELLIRLLSEQARIDSQAYSVLPSLEALDDAKAEIKRLETRIADAKRKVKVEMKIRDAAVALRKAYRGSTYISPSSSGFGSRLSRLSVGLSNYGGSRPSSPAEVPPLPSAPSTSTSPVSAGTTVKMGRRERTNSIATSVSASASGAATPTQGQMSLLPAEKLKAEAKAESDVLAATLKVDSVTRDLYAISDRAATVRATVLEHQARVLVHRVETLEAELVGRGGRSADEERKALEREKMLLEEKTKHQGLIEQLKAEMENVNGTVREMESKMAVLEEQLRESEMARSAHLESHEVVVQQHAELSKERDALVAKNEGAEESHRAAISYHGTRIAGLESALDLAKRAIDAAKRELAESRTETERARATTKTAEDRTALAVEEERLKRVEVQRLADDERIKRSDLEDQVEELEGSLRSVQADAHRLEKELEETQTTVSVLEKDLAGAKMSAAEAQTEAEQLKVELSRSETQLKDTQAELSSVSKEIEKRYEDRVNRLTAESEVGKAAFKAQQELEKRVKGQQSELVGVQSQLEAANEKIVTETKRRQVAEERDLDLVTNVSKLESEKKRAQDQIAQLQKELEGQRTAAKNALREQLEAESRASKLEAQLADVERQASTHRDEAQTAKQERDTLDGQVRSHLAEIATLAAAVQQHQDSTRAVQDDHEVKVSDLSRAVDEHMAVAVQAKDDHAKALGELESLSRQLAEMQEQLEVARNEAKSEAKLRDEFETQNEKLEESIEELDAQTKALIADKTRLTAELETLRMESAAELKTLRTQSAAELENLEHLKAESQLAQQFEDRNEQLEEEIEELKLKAAQTLAELEQLRAQSGGIADEVRAALEAEQKAHAETKAELVNAVDSSAKVHADINAKHVEAVETFATIEKAHAATLAELAESKARHLEAVEASEKAHAETQAALAESKSSHLEAAGSSEKVHAEIRAELAEAKAKHLEAAGDLEKAHAETRAELAESQAKLLEATAAVEKAQNGSSAELAEARTKLAQAVEAVEKAHDETKAELADTKAELAEVKEELTETKEELIESQAELAEAVEVADQHEEALQDAMEKLDAASQKLGDVLAKLQQTSAKLQSVLQQLAQTESRATAAEKQFHDLELATDVERRQMAERDELYHAFELRLENAEKRLRAEDERCARLLGKHEGRDTMDDLLEQIKTGSTVAKKRTAGQDIAELLTSLSEHITDLADELVRGGGSVGSRGLGGSDGPASTSNADEQIQNLEEEVELLEAEAVKWKRDADEARGALDEERKANEGTQEELTLMEEEAMRWKRDAEEARKLLQASERDSPSIASPSVASLATIKKLVLSSPPPPQELPGATPEEKLSHAVVELQACRQAMHAISALLPNLAAHGSDLAALGVSPTIGLGLVEPANYPSAAEDAAVTAERVHASLAVTRVEQYKLTLQSLLRNHAQLRKWHLTARQREKKLEATILELRGSLDDFRCKAKRADLMNGASLNGSTSSPSTPTSQSSGAAGLAHGGVTSSSLAANGNSISVGYHPRQLSILPKGSRSRLGMPTASEPSASIPATASPIN
ncbi:unnamed protein product [Tilletia controversa]|uniref:Up-regulated during septation protein 1 domain-containing protein n=3 Tax=Tilletia TaxID=13289 RepID=A0A8X7N0T0_9BASI|nr:hypothetical protein CF336_g100 [Tilletia laevis]KAE8204961.1 hypothetical protein CF328_g771 [Tilletia controversa]KAE8265084.1 hypothetical protein A4X03_0g496 [Tilletia caries]KAE8208544.1 hypothetical protein CF335_g333 [Tilletia laevis]KAE8255929.1 hypothetical protein A4X06_0g168 [Tilletia controversa]